MPGSSLLLLPLLMLVLALLPGRAAAAQPKKAEPNKAEPKPGTPQVWDGGAWHELDEEIHPDDPRPCVLNLIWFWGVVGWGWVV